MKEIKKYIDIDKYIIDNHVPKIDDPFTIDQKTGTFSEKGLYSPTIFGKGEEQYQKIAYIPLGVVVLEPFIYFNASIINIVFKHLVNRTKQYKFVDGKFVEVLSKDTGETGVKYLYKHWDNIDWDEYETDKNKILLNNFRKLTKSHFFSHNIIVMPMGFRPYVEAHGLIMVDPITELYEKIIRSKNQSEYIEKSMQSVGGKQALIQKYYNDIFKMWFDTYQSKQGNYQSSYAAKRVDNTATLVANANPEVPLNSCVVPWHTLLVTFDNMIIAQLLKDEELRESLGMKDSVNAKRIAESLQYIERNPDLYSKQYPNRKTAWIKLLENLFNKYPEIGVMLKRNPAFDVKSYAYYKVIINTDNESAVIVPPIIYNNLGADSFDTDFFIHETKGDYLKIVDGYRVTPIRYSKITPTYKIVKISTMGEFYGNISE